MFPAAVRLLLITVVLSAGCFDMRYRRIPNLLTVSAAALGFLTNTALFGEMGTLNSAEGLGVALLAYVPLYLLRAMGAGDVKLMAAVGAVAGPANWVLIFLVTSVLGGVAAVTLVVFRRQVFQTWFNLKTLITELVQLRAPWKANGGLDVHDTRASRLPHGAVIAGGALLCTFLGYLN